MMADWMGVRGSTGIQYWSGEEWEGVLVASSDGRLEGSGRVLRM